MRRLSFLAPLGVCSPSAAPTSVSAPRRRGSLASASAERLRSVVSAGAASPPNSSSRADWTWCHSTLPTGSFPEPTVYEPSKLCGGRSLLRSSLSDDIDPLRAWCKVSFCDQSGGELVVCKLVQACTSLYKLVRVHVRTTYELVQVVRARTAVQVRARTRCNSCIHVRTYVRT